MTSPAASTLRTLIVDDEALARRRLRQLLDGCTSPRIEVRGEAADARALGAALDALEVDLLFLDIDLPGLGGLAAAGRLTPGATPPALVFVTAHGGHALQAYELGAVDYLRKPVHSERLQRALNRADAMVRAARLYPASASHGAGAIAGPTATAPEPALRVHARNRDERLPLREVLYIKAELKYLTVVTPRHRHLMSGSLEDLETRYGDHFVRVHRNALVARWALRALVREPARSPAATSGAATGSSGWCVQLATLDEMLPISRRQLSAVRAAWSRTAEAS